MKMLKIYKCDDPMRWYAGMVGEITSEWVGE
mgnify:CR=1 FL=1|jgi:hypothetical protein